MNSKTPFIVVVLLMLTAVLVACQPETIVETVTVTRVVTETDETVAVTRVVVEEIEVTTADEVDDSFSSVGSEVAASGLFAPTPEPDTETKVETNSTSDADADDTDEVMEEAPSEPRAEDGFADTEAASGEDAVADIPATTSAVALSLDQNSRLTAGEVDDNAKWDDYVAYLRNYRGARVIEVDVSERHQIWVTDSIGNPILGARIDIVIEGQVVETVRTHSNGLAYFFPRTLSVTAEMYELNITVNGRTETLTIPTDTSQRTWTVIHTGGDQISSQTQLDILFLIDATGSMADEINQLKENIRAISAQIDALPAQPDVRFGMVTYRDRGDDYITRVFDFTPGIEQFAQALAAVRADGGGDYPEDLNEALSDAVHEVEWRVENTVSLIFLVADAPPHLDYAQENHYGVEIMEAAERGIKIYPIASSGLDMQGEYIFRQLAQYTGGRFIFLTYGADGAGSGSTGTETTFDVDDYTVSSLDALVVQIVEEELAYLVR